MQITEPLQLWKAALGDLELQMTRATFNTWLRDTQCTGLDTDGQTLIVTVKNEYAIEWLENRLSVVVDRTLHRLTNNGARVRYITRPAASPPPSANPAALPTPSGTDGRIDDWVAPEFDPGDTKKVTGWIPLPEYATLFWAPLLGAPAWRIWEIVRRHDIRREKTEFTPALRFSVPQLAKLIPCSPQAITGRNVRCDENAPGAQQIAARGGPRRLGNGAPELIWARHYPGALEILEREGVAAIERHGDRKAAAVLISVRVSLPLLHPSQVDQLPADLQAEHDRWIADHGLNPSDWQ